jgi:aspartate/methionine/tyrosine aminotransferase
VQRFSSRLKWDWPPNQLAQVLAAKRRGGARILDLTESNPTRAGFAYPETEILEALGDARSLRYEPTPAGLPAAREAVAGYYRARGIAVEPERIFLTASTSEAYSHVFKLLADPADEILVPRPSYPLFEYLAGLEALRPVAYPLAYQGQWSLDVEALQAVVTTRTRAIVLVNPNNPTGSFVKREELERLVLLCEQTGLTIISDEVFSDYTFAADSGQVATLVGMDQVLTFCLSGLSKVAGLPQMKVGWLVLAGPSAAQAAAHERLELIADTFLSVSTPSQHALPRLLTLGATIREQIHARVRENLSWLRAAVRGAPSCRVLNVEGGWYAILQVPRTGSEEEWCLELLEQDNVLVQPGFFYDFESEAFLVVSLLPEPQVFREGVQRLLDRAAREASP